MEMDISNADVVTVDGIAVPVQLIRALAKTNAVRVRVEAEDASAEDIEITRDSNGGVHFVRNPISVRGTDQNPAHMEFRAELVSPDKRSRVWVERGSQREFNLISAGWKEEGRTRPRVAGVSPKPDDPTTPRGAEHKPK